MVLGWMSFSGCLFVACWKGFFVGWVIDELGVIEEQDNLEALDNIGNLVELGNLDDLEGGGFW